MHEAQKVFDVIFISSHQATEVVQPREQPLDFPAMPIPAQHSPVLGGISNAIAAMRRDHVDAPFLKLSIQPVAVVGAVSDQSRGIFINKALLKGSFDKGDFMRRSRRCVDGDRNTSAVCHCHELRTFAPLGFPHCAAPFLAPTKVPSMKHCAKSSLPRFRKSSASASSICLSVPPSTQYWNRRWQVWSGGKRSGQPCQRPPERKIHRISLSISRSSLLRLTLPSALLS